MNEISLITHVASSSEDVGEFFYNFDFQFSGSIFGHFSIRIQYNYNSKYVFLKLF